MPNKEFLESYPLYRRFTTDHSIYDDLRAFERPAIHMACAVCRTEQTFNMANDYDELESADQHGFMQAPGKIVRAKYVCSSCNAFSRVFFLHFWKITTGEGGEARTLVTVSKVGQTPSWEISPDKELADLLGKHSDLYKKALVSESQSYGIGAYAYYRRIVESIIDELLESILDLIDDEHKAVYKEALEATRKTRVTEEKINLVKDLLPPSLRPSGLNPLEVLHSALSEGLREQTDESCLEQADEIKSVLGFLVNQIQRTKHNQRKFSEGMKKILDLKAQKLSAQKPKSVQQNPSQGS